MGLEVEQRELVDYYFSLDQIISSIERRIKLSRELFYSKSMHTRQEDIDYSIVTVGFRQEREVVTLVDCLSNFERHIEKCKKKRRYLKDYLHTLPENDRKYIQERFKDGLEVPVREEVEEALIDEISEIEEAIQFMYGFEPEPKDHDVIGNREADYTQALMLLGVKQ